MPSIVESSPDLVAVLTNVGIFSMALTATVAGIWRAIKKIKDETIPTTTTTKVAAATILENTTLLMWSESNRAVVEQSAMLRTAVCDLKDSMVELRHEIEIDRALREQRRR